MDHAARVRSLEQALEQRQRKKRVLGDEGEGVGGTPRQWSLETEGSTIEEELIERETREKGGGGAGGSGATGGVSGGSGRNSPRFKRLKSVGRRGSGGSSGSGGGGGGGGSGREGGGVSGEEEGEMGTNLAGRNGGALRTSHSSIPSLCDAAQDRGIRYASRGSALLPMRVVQDARDARVPHNTRIIESQSLSMLHSARLHSAPTTRDLRCSLHSLYTHYFLILKRY